MKKLLIYYNFTLASLLVISGFLSATTLPQLLVATLFYPLLIYFALLVIPKRNKAVIIPKTAAAAVKPRPSPPPLTAHPLPDHQRYDLDRRAFLKIIGSAGISVFIYTLFSNRAEAAFFGSVPGPGVIGLKDSTGTRIDPAEKQPTDGYKITEIDDASLPAYYGFVNKTGAWFIQREGSSGDYRYVRGSSGFSTNWTNRASLSYDYFDNVF